MKIENKTEIETLNDILNRVSLMAQTKFFATETEINSEITTIISTIIDGTETTILRETYPKNIKSLAYQRIYAAAMLYLVTSLKNQTEDMSK